MSRSLGPSPSPLPLSRPAGPSPSCDQTPGTVPNQPSSAATSSGLGTSTSTTGTSTASAGTSGVTTSTTGAGGTIGEAESDASGAAYRQETENADELMSLLETIEAQGRQLVRQTRRGETDSAPGLSPSAANVAEGGARPRCVNCDRTEGHGRDVGSIPGAGGGFAARRRLADQRRPADVGDMEGVAAELTDWGPGFDRYVQTALLGKHGKCSA